MPVPRWVRRPRPNWAAAATWTVFTVVECVALWGRFGYWTLAPVVAGVAVGAAMTIRAWRAEDRR